MYEKSIEYVGIFVFKNLTPIGGNQIVKYFAISKIMSKAAIISVPAVMIKVLVNNLELFSFIWKGNVRL